MKLRVAIFHTTLPQPDRKISGVESTVHRLANSLVDFTDASVTVFSCDRKPIDARYAHVELFPGKIRGLFNVLVRLPLALNFVDFSKFDILHLHGDDWFFVNRRIPTIRSMHGSALREAQGATSLKRKVLQFLLFPCECLSVFFATMTIAAAEDTRKLYGLKEVVDIYGVDQALFKPRDKWPTPLIFYVGTWGGRKRGKVAFEVFTEKILPRFPGAKLYMAADYRTNHPSVIDGGFPSNSELARVMAKSWIFLYPSSYEGFGIPYIEALASATAIVTTRNQGAEHVLEHGRYGCITDDSDFGEAAVSLLGDNARRLRYEQAGIKRAEHYFWPDVATRHIAAYTETIARSGKAR